MSDGGSTATLQKLDIADRVIQYKVTESREGELETRGLVVFEGGGSGFGVDFDEFTDAGGDGREDNFQWSIADGEVTLELADGETVTLTGIQSKSTFDGTEVYTITTTDPASSDMVMRRSVPFAESDFSGNSYVVDVNIEDAANGTATSGFGSGTFDDGGDRLNEDVTWEVDPEVGFLTINLTGPEEEITMVNPGDTTDDADFDEVLVVSESFDSGDNTFDEVYPDSSLTRQ